jgi:two-component system CheB/CheR fusion protein
VSATAAGNPLRTILELLQRRHGQSFIGYKQRMLTRRMERRMGLLGIEKISEYVKRLRRDNKELGALHKDLLIGVTEFFRDRKAWAALDTQVLRPLIASKKNGEPIRAWVAGASTGEEAYTLTMLILAQLRRVRKRCPVQVFGTDANDNALAHARNGIYPAGIAHQVRPEYLSRYFQEIKGDHHYQVSPELRESVIFGVHNLLVHPPFSRLDLVTCRNLLIYLDPEMQQRILLVFHFALRPDGYLFLGSAETIGANDKLYRPVARKWRIYRRIGTTPQDQLAWYADTMTHGMQWPGSPPIAVVPARSTYLASAARNALVDHFAPAAVVIDARMEPLYFSGPTERFLLQRHGTRTGHLLPLLPTTVRSKLPAAIRQIQGGKATVSIGNIRIRSKSRAAVIRIDVVPILAKPGNAKSQLYLVAFQEEPRGAARIGLMPAKASAAHSRLQDELRMTREDLQSTVEQLETSNEELRASHEEIVSVNEELQSMNEELESSKEELQSVNEELNTVNTQLQDKISQLEASNNDLRNLLASGEMATVCLDRSFRIKWFRPATHKLFNLLPTDVGRPIGDLSPIAADPTLLDDARAVLQTLIPRSTEIEHNGVHLRRIFPYRTADERIDGVVITFSDITDAKRAAQQEIEAKAAANELLERRVRERSEELMRVSRELAVAEVHERQKIARDLHDGLGQELNAAVIKLDDALRITSGNSKSKPALEQVAALLGHVVREMRSLTAQINPPVLDQLGLMPAIEWLGEEMRKTYQLEVAIEDDNLPKPLDHVGASIVFRAVRELLINVVRHAKVKTVRISAQRTDGTLKIQVIDQGVGLALDGAALKSTVNLGLATIRERVAYIGGALTMEGARGQGTTATIEVPLSLT